MAGQRASTAGRLVTLIGADGAGKSTQARRLCAQAGVRATYIYMGSNPSAITHALPSTRAWTGLKRLLGKTVHHSGPPEPGIARRPSSPVTRGLRHLKSLIMVGLRVSDDLYRLLLARSLARRGHVVVLDRHPYADHYMRRVKGTGGWLRWGDRIHKLLLERIYPRPRELILLDAPAEVLHARKPEGSLAALRARRQEYLDLVGALPGGVSVSVVDVARSEDAVLSDLLEIVGGARSVGPRAGHPDEAPPYR